MFHLYNMCFNANVIFKTVICCHLRSTFKFLWLMSGYMSSYTYIFIPFLYIVISFNIMLYTISLSVNSVLYANVFYYIDLFYRL